jgi:hypothetical protein
VRGYAGRSLQAGAIAIVLAATAAPAQDRPRPQPPDAATLVASLENTAANPAIRRAAAGLLLDIARTNLTALDALEKAIASPLTADGAAGLIVSAITFADDPPQPLLLALEARAEGATSPEECVAVLRAVAVFRSRHAARILVRHASPDRSPVVVEASTAALATLTGRTDLPRDHALLEAWIASQDDLNEAEWQRSIVRQLARRVAKEETDAALMAGRLIDANRRLHLITPADKRPALLVDLIRDSLPAVRDLGFELAARELANNGSIDASVGEAAVSLLASPDAFARGQAALLVRQIAPPNASEAVSDALLRETDPNVASDLLLAATRWPTPASISAVLAWLTRGGQTRQAAIEACLQITRSVTIANSDRDTMLEAVRRIPLEDYTPAAATLMAEQGDEEDRGRLAPLLQRGSTSLRLAIAEALSWHPEHEQAIIDAAETTPELVPVAAKAVMVHGARAQDVIRVMRARAVTPEASRAAIAMLASTTPATELLEAVKACTEPPMRSILLASLTNPARALSERADPAALDAIVEGVLMAAEEDLSLGDAAAALAVLDASAFIETSPLAARASCLRVTSLLATGKIDQVRSLDAPLAAWLRGFDLASGTSIAAAVAGELLARFDTQLSDGDRSRLRAAVASAAFIGPPPPD